MGKYLLPLGIFVGGMIINLILYLFLGAVGDAATQLQTDTAAMAPTFWNWSWVSNPDVVKFLVLIFGLLLTLLGTAKAFLKVR